MGISQNNITEIPQQEDREGASKPNTDESKVDLVNYSGKLSEIEEVLTPGTIHYQRRKQGMEDKEEVERTKTKERLVTTQHLKKLKSSQSQSNQAQAVRSKRANKGNDESFTSSNISDVEDQMNVSCVERGKGFSN